MTDVSYFVWKLLIFVDFSYLIFLQTSSIYNFGLWDQISRKFLSRINSCLFIFLFYFFIDCGFIRNLLWKIESDEQLYWLTVTDKNYDDGRFSIERFVSLFEEIENIILYLGQTANTCSFIIQNCLLSKITFHWRQIKDEHVNNILTL